MGIRRGDIVEDRCPIPDKTARWVLVAGGFHRNGGMDRLNWALARYLVERGDAVHLVCHRAEPELANEAAAVHIVPRPGASFMLGGLLLARAGRNIARQVSRRFFGTRVVVNGGNCDWPDINWVHCVHHAWTTADDSSPAWFKLKNRASRRLACIKERSALRSARLVIANSEKTRRELIEHLAIDPKRIHAIYPGTYSGFSPPTLKRRAAARVWLGKDHDKPIVAFVGALGYDSNKGFDVLFPAWRRLCAQPGWDADLIVAGGGRALESWRRQIGEAGLDGRITTLGFTNRIPDLLAAADLLVSPVRYEAYGLNVQEAICCGIPAMVTESAGVAERYPAELRGLLIPDLKDVETLADVILRWRGAMPYWKERTAPFSETMRRHTLQTMAAEIAALVECDSAAPTDGAT
jgi:glycosyltransferase involved in cell wall biosynthesis